MGLLWSDTAIDDETDTLRKYQSWQFVADPAGSGKYAMVCEAWPDGSVSPTASAASTDGTWSYDYTTRHYNFVLGEGSYYGKDGENHYYSIRSDQYTGQVHEHGRRGANSCASTSMAIRPTATAVSSPSSTSTPNRPPNRSPSPNWPTTRSSAVRRTASSALRPRLSTDCV